MEYSIFDKIRYFPDEHKVAVYLPLFLPVCVPLLAGLSQEYKHRKEKKANQAKKNKEEEGKKGEDRKKNDKKQREEKDKKDSSVLQEDIHKFKQEENIQQEHEERDTHEEIPETGKNNFKEQKLKKKNRKTKDSM